jgi:Phage integrase family
MLLFPGPRGVWTDRYWYDEVWYPARKAAGIDPTPHEFRHSTISHMRAAGIDPADLAAMSGHTVETATKHYTPRARPLVRRGARGGGGFVLRSHRGRIQAGLGSGMRGFNGFIIRRSQVQILPGPFSLSHPIAWICRSRAGFGGIPVRKLRHARMPLHGLAGKSRSHPGPTPRPREAGRCSGRGSGRATSRLCAARVQAAQGAGAVVMPTGAGDQPGPGRRLGRRRGCGRARCAARTSARAGPRPAGHHPRSLCGVAPAPAAPGGDRRPAAHRQSSSV